MHAVWFLRRRQMAVKLRFWLTIVGYDPRDRSLNQSIYLVYAAIFFAIWGLATLSLFAGVTAQAFQLISPGPIEPVLAAAGGLLLAAWFIVSLVRYARKSPLVFGVEDSQLLCQTPVRRDGLALAWLLGDWPSSGIPFWIVAILLGFARMEAELAGTIGAADLPVYVLSGLRAFSVMISLQFGLLALAWAWGALRLHGGKDKPGLFYASVLIAGLFGAGAIYTLGHWGLAGFSETVWMIVAWPIARAMEAAYGMSAWLGGWLIGLGMAMLGIACLWAASGNVNLSRATQETAGADRGAGAYPAARKKAVRHSRLNRWLAAWITGWSKPLHGAGWLVWKQMMQGARSLALGDVAGLVWPVVLLAGAVFTPDVPAQLTFLLFYIIAVENRGAGVVNSELSVWWLYHSLPVEGGRLLLITLALPWIMVTFLGWIVIAAGRYILGGLVWPAAAGVPVLAALLLLAAAVDVLQQTSTALLLGGFRSDIRAGSVLVCGLCVALAGGAFWALKGSLWIAIPIAAAIAVGLIVLAWRLGIYYLKRVG
jgi:hypothetical protein